MLVLLWWIVCFELESGNWGAVIVMFCSMQEGNVSSLYDSITTDLDVGDLEFSNSWIEESDFTLFHAMYTVDLHI